MHGITGKTYGLNHSIFSPLVFMYIVLSMGIRNCNVLDKWRSR